MNNEEKILIINKEIMALYLWNQFKSREYKNLIKERACLHGIFKRTREIEKLEKEKIVLPLKKAADETNNIWNGNYNKNKITGYIFERYELSCMSKMEFYKFRNLYANMELRKEFLFPDENEVKDIINILQSEFLANIALFCKDDYERSFIDEILKFSILLNNETIGYYEKAIINKVDEDTKIIEFIANKKRL